MLWPRFGLRFGTTSTQLFVERSDSDEDDDEDSEQGHGPEDGCFASAVSAGGGARTPTELLLELDGWVQFRVSPYFAPSQQQWST